MTDHLSDDEIVQSMIEVALQHGKVEIGVIVHPEVSLPPHLYSEPMVKLSLSHKFPGTNMDFGSGDSLSASLMFKGERFRCVVPYRAVFMIRGGNDTVMFKERVDPRDIPDIKKSGVSLFSFESHALDSEPVPTEPTIKDRMTARGFRVIEGGSNDV